MRYIRNCDCSVEYSLKRPSCLVTVSHHLGRNSHNDDFIVLWRSPQCFQDANGIKNVCKESYLRKHESVTFHFTQDCPSIAILPQDDEWEGIVMGKHRNGWTFYQLNPTSPRMHVSLDVADILENGKKKDSMWKCKWKNQLPVI